MGASFHSARGTEFRPPVNVSIGDQTDESQKEVNTGIEMRDQEVKSVGKDSLTICMY